MAQGHPTTPFLLLFGVKKVLSCSSQPHLRPEELMAAQSPGAEPRASRDLLKSTFWAQSHENAAWFHVQVCIGSPECEKCCGFNSFSRQELGGVFQHHYLVPLRECSSCLLSASKKCHPGPWGDILGLFLSSPTGLVFSRALGVAGSLGSSPGGVTEPGCRGACHWERVVSISWAAELLCQLQPRLFQGSGS